MTFPLFHSDHIFVSITKLKRMSELCFSANCRLMMMYFDVVLVVGVLGTLTSAMDGLQTTAGKLEAISDNNGVAQCVISPPNMTVSARSKIDCMRSCLLHGCSCAYGANYHSDDRTCAFHSEPPDSFQQVPNCIYYQVLTFFYRVFQKKPHKV